MKIDQNKVLEMEHVSKPGAVGDSMAETGRLEHLDYLLRNNDRNLDLSFFRTEKGYIRHTDIPEDWKETDSTSDQCLPWYLACINTHNDLAKEMKQRIKRDRYRTGNGDLINPMFFAILIENRFLLSLFVALQALLFKVIYRWNDEKNKFEESEGSTCDYINWIHCAIYTYPIVRNMVSKTILKEKVKSYYAIEPNCLWLIELYNRVIDEKWNKN